MGIKGFFFMVVFSFLLVGCMENQSIEDIAIMQIAGYDQAEEDKIKGTVAIPEFGQEDASSATELYLTVEANSVKDVEKEIQRQSSKPVSIGKLEVVLYSEELAKNDISDIFDVFSRDPRLSRNMYLGIVSGDTHSLIQGKYTQDETTAKHLRRLIKNNMEFNFPSSTLHDFLYAYYAEGMDGFLPTLNKKETFVDVEGISFFDGGKLVANISSEKTFVFKMMKENFDKGMQDLKFKGGVVVMENIGSRVNYEMKGSVQEPEFSIKVKLKAVVNEMVGIDQEANKALSKEMEEAFTDYYEKEANSMIGMFQENKIDPLGLGNFLKTRKKNFELKRWEENYSEVPIKVKVDVEITEYGIFS